MSTITKALTVLVAVVATSTVTPAAEANTRGGHLHVGPVRDIPVSCFTRTPAPAYCPPRFQHRSWWWTAYLHYNR